MTRWLQFLLFGAGLLWVSPGHAESLVEPLAPAVERPSPWSSEHPVALGARLLGRVGDGYVMAGVGGHVRLRLYDWLRTELFADSFAAPKKDGAFRHDHEIGGTLQVPLVSSPTFVLYPMLGACAMLTVLNPGNDIPSVKDIRFGLHVGIGAEWAVAKAFSVQAQLENITYVGHDIVSYGFSARTEPDLSYFITGQVSLTANYWF